MNIAIKDMGEIIGIETAREGDDGYTLAIAFKNGDVVVYGFKTLKDFLVSYSEFMYRYKG